MELIAIILLGLLIVSTGAFYNGFALVAALGLLAWWCLKLQKRITALELETDRLQTMPARAAQPLEDPPSEPAVAPAPQPRVTAPPNPVSPTMERAETNEPAPDPKPEPEPVRRFYPEEYFEPTQSPLDKFIERCKTWITSGNVPVKVGVILSVFGLAFLVKEAIDRSWLVLPIEFRLIGVAVFGLAMLIIGWRLREARAGYGLSLQGGGIAIVYLTTYAAYGIYGLIPAVPAFALLVLTTCAAGVLATKQNARALAMLGIVGGFMAPILASSGSGDHVVLFSYYAILNGAIIAIAWQKAWRELNVAGFVFTFLIGSIWGYSGYSASEFSTTEPFLILFFLIYLLVPILFARSVRPDLRGFVDGTLVFGTPLVAFTLQAVLVDNFEYGLAWSAGVLTVLYAGLSAMLLLRGPDYMRVLGEAFAGLAVVFLAITIPLTFDAQATSLAWAVQGTAMCWLGWRQSRPLPMLAGVALQGLAAAAWFVSDNSSYGLPAILNGPYLGAVTIALAAAVSSRIFDLQDDRKPQAIMQLAAGALLLWSALWWFGAGFSEIDRVVAWEYEIKSGLAFAAGSVAIAAGVTRITDWTRPAVLGLVLVPVLISGTVWVFESGQPFAAYGWAAWIAVFAGHLFYLKNCEGLAPRISRILHPLGFIALTAVALAEVHWHANQWMPGIWPEAIVLALLALVLVALVRHGRRVTWPIAAEPTAYLAHAGGCIAAAGSVLMLTLNVSSNGAAGALTYIPVLNPLELASIGFATCLLLYLRSLSGQELAGERLERALQYARPGIAVLGWLLLTMICARSVHHYAGVAFDPDALFASEVFQATLSIVWGACAFGAMIIGTRRASRFVWLAGGSLMSIVVIKLFLIDLANTATVERVISFLGVGVLLLVVGYFAPVPPRDALDEGGSDPA